MYFPLSQISTNLSTNGGEFVYLTTKQPYSGNYWKTSTGKFYTGKTPQDTPTQELIPVASDTGVTPPTPILINSYYNQMDDNNEIYIDLVKPPSPALPPLYSVNIPTQQDYSIGEYRRYFCKKTNEIVYLEINKDTYDKLVGKDSKILYQLYQPFNLPWQLTGDKSQVFITNKNITELTSKQQKLPMLSEYLRNDFTKYYK
jgi:hypothetical protein